jgi:hypothetical protein
MVYFSSEWIIPTRHGTKAPKDSIYQASDTGAGERVPLQQIPDQKEED